MRLTGDGRAGRHTGRNRQISLPQYEELLTRQQAFSSLHRLWRHALQPVATGRGALRRWPVGVGKFLRDARRHAAAGRLIGSSRRREGLRPGVAVISYALWQSQFGGRADIVGQTLPGPGTRLPIIGVTSPEFFGVEVGRQFGVAMPICASGNTTARSLVARGDRTVEARVDRRAGAVAPAGHPARRAARRDADFRADWPALYEKMGVQSRRRVRRRLAAAAVVRAAAVDPDGGRRPRAADRVGQSRQPAAGARDRAPPGVRDPARHRRHARTRASAGADREPAAGRPWIDRRPRCGVRGQPIDPAADQHRRRSHPSRSRRWTGASSASRRSPACVTALVFGLAPALRLAATPVVGRGDRGAAGNDGAGLRRVLVAAQIAVTLVLLFGGLLFLRTFRNLSTQDTGVQRARRRRRQRLLPRVARFPPEKRVGGVSRSRRAAARHARRDQSRRAPSRRRSADRSGTPTSRSITSSPATRTSTRSAPGISRRSARRSSPAATSTRATCPAAPGSPSSPSRSPTVL